MYLIFLIIIWENKWIGLYCIFRLYQCHRRMSRASAISVISVSIFCWKWIVICFQRCSFRLTKKRHDKVNNDKINSILLYGKNPLHTVRGFFIFFYLPNFHRIVIIILSTKKLVNSSLHPWSEEISLVEEWISLDSKSSGVKFTSQRVESRPVHSLFTPNEVITDVTPQGVTSVTKRVKIHSIFLDIA